jgi:hypothetical protein
MSVYDGDDLEPDYYGGRDVPRAVAAATGFANAVIQHRVNPVPHLEYFEAVADTLFDAPGGSPGLLVCAVKEGAPAFRAAESLATTPERRLDLRMRPLLLIARAHHVAGDNPRHALKQSYTALCMLEQVSEGGGLLDALASPTPNAVADHAVATGAILSATIKRAPFDSPDARRRLVDICRALFGAYALHGRDPVLYPRTAAFAAQFMYLMIAVGNPSDRPFVEAARALDIVARPSHTRGQATVDLREHAYARYCGDMEAARAHGVAAIARLERFPLPRHLRVVTEQHYVAE